MYLFYCWYILEKHGLMNTSIQHLSNNIKKINGGDGVQMIFNAAWNCCETGHLLWKNVQDVIIDQMNEIKKFHVYKWK